MKYTDEEIETLFDSLHTAEIRITALEKDIISQKTMRDEVESKFADAINHMILETVKIIDEFKNEVNNNLNELEQSQEMYTDIEIDQAIEQFKKDFASKRVYTDNDTINSKTNGNFSLGDLKKMIKGNELKEMII